MALINCPECENEVSDVALNCPHCGGKLREPKRTLFGKIIKWIFIIWNIIMLFSIIGGISSASEGYNSMNNAEQAGTVLGASIGLSLIGGIWFFGTVILGLFVLFTKPKS